MIRPWREGRSSFRHGAHVSAVARMDDGKQTYILGDTGRAGLHNLSNGDSMNAPVRRNKKGARCQPLTTGLGNLDPEAVLRPSQSRP